MSKSRRASRKPIYTILALSLAIALGFAAYRPLYPRPIFLINPDQPGKLRHLSLVLRLRPILLDVKGLNVSLAPVSVTGYLLLADGDTPMSMIVSRLLLNKTMKNLASKRNHLNPN
jgi:hypothetical protein